MKKKKIYTIIGWIAIIMFLAISIFPFVWILITSFKPEYDVFGENAFRIISSDPTLGNYHVVLFEKGIMRAVANSFITSLITTLYVVLIASMSAYIIARFHFRGKNVLMAFILSVSMFPQMIVVGPIFNMFYKLNLLNSYWITLAFSTITLPTAVWIMVTHFKQVPISLEEAARIDGCSAWGTLWRIIFPIAAPGVFTTGIMTFITAWNEYLLSCTMNINESFQTVPVKINYLKSQFSVLWGEISAATIIVVIPTLIIVLLFQKQIVAGIVNGAVKE